MTLPVGAVVSAGSPAGSNRVVTLLGVRYLDLAAGRPVTSGLVTFARSLQVAVPPVRGLSNPSGTFGFHDLPGLRALEHPVEPAGPGSPPASAPFLVTVADTADRFLPALFSVDVPFLPPPGSPPEGLLPLPVLDAPLFSAPTRPVPTGFAAVRAELWDRDADEPAAWALVRVAVGDRRSSGISDENGQVLVMCPAPTADTLRLASPPHGNAPPPRPAPQTWPVTVEVYSSPWLPPPPALPVGAGALPAPWSALPGMRAILDGQPRARVWARIGGPPAPSWTGTLTYGNELVLRTTSLSRLWISRGASPP